MARPQQGVPWVRSGDSFGIMRGGRCRRTILRLTRGNPAAVLGAEKEHVMVGVQIRLDGRPGLLLADPGYHVPRVVTVMADRAYPHTGWFTQSDESHCRKEYNYVYSPQHSGYVEWQERENRAGVAKCQTSLVYVARPFLDGVNVTERRNLVYNFRSLLSRDQKGHVLAGLYFPVGARGKEHSSRCSLITATRSGRRNTSLACFWNLNGEC
ncbi:hypothetical protein ACJJTC_012519 [Scirpophaga incertulas]